MPDSFSLSQVKKKMRDIGYNYAARQNVEELIKHLQKKSILKISYPSGQVKAKISITNNAAINDLSEIINALGKIKGVDVTNCLKIMIMLKQLFSRTPVKLSVLNHFLTKIRKNNILNENSTRLLIESDIILIKNEKIVLTERGFYLSTKLTEILDNVGGGAHSLIGKIATKQISAMINYSSKYNVEPELMLEIDFETSSVVPRDSQVLFIVASYIKGIMGRKYVDESEIIPSGDNQKITIFNKLVSKLVSTGFLEVNAIIRAIVTKAKKNLGQINSPTLMVSTEDFDLGSLKKIVYKRISMANPGIPKRDIIESIVL